MPARSTPHAPITGFASCASRVAAHTITHIIRIGFFMRGRLSPVGNFEIENSSVTRAVDARLRHGIWLLPLFTSGGKPMKMHLRLIVVVLLSVTAAPFAAPPKSEVPAVAERELARPNYDLA